jgi:chromosome segregation ATPase
MDVQIQSELDTTKSKLIEVEKANTNLQILVEEKNKSCQQLESEIRELQVKLDTANSDIVELQEEVIKLKSRSGGFEGGSESGWSDERSKGKKIN